MKHLIKTTILMLAILLPAIVHAHDFEVDGIYYNINGNEATVTCRGTFSSQYSNEYSGSVTIPASVTYDGTTYSVTEIGTYAFYGCYSLTNINIPNSVTNISSSAFHYCGDLTNISVDNNNPNYDSRNNCNAIIESSTNTLVAGCKNTIIPNSVTNIGPASFYGCTGLTSINMPNSVTSIGISAFENCSSLATINIPNSVTSIGELAFNGTAWYDNQPDGLVYAGLVAYGYKGDMPEGTSITLKEGTTGIACKAFSYCSSLTNINFPNSITNIDEETFFCCTSLTTINIPNSVTNIGSYAFTGCSNLTNIIIPNSVTSIGCDTFDGTNWYNNQPDGLVYAGLVAYRYKGTMPEGTSITLKEGTTGIASWAFSDCCLTNIKLPNSVTNIGDHAFDDCYKLTNINIPNSVTKIGSYAFCCCSSLTNINIPNSVTSISDHTFDTCYGLTNINIPNSVTNIGIFAFYGCNSLTSICIPNSVTTIGTWAFSGCSLAAINIPNSVTNIGDGAFYCCYSLNEVYCYATIPPECIYKYYGTFSNYSSTLHVPEFSLAAYFTAPEWSKFENVVGDAVAPTRIIISKDSLEMTLGQQQQLTATVIPANASCKDVIWYSTDPNVATVENGIVTAVGYGECDIFAYCMGMPAICHISVTNRISLEQQEAMLLPNHMLTLNPTAPVMPAGFTVTSSDPTVAAARVINSKVQIVGIKEGTTTITVTSSDGTATPATCLVTVYTEPGDMNCDGFVRISDVTALINYLLSGDETGFKVANADLNNDSKVSIADVTALINILLTTETE